MTSNTTSAVAVIAVLLTAVVAAQGRDTDQAGRSASARGIAIRTAVTEARADEEVVTLVRAGLDDPDTSVRAEASRSLAVYLLTVAPVQTEAGRSASAESWLAVRRALLSTLSSSDDELRYEAVLAVTNLDSLRISKSRGKISAELTRALVERQRLEWSARVRAEIMKTIGLASDRAPDVVTTLLGGLEAAGDGERQFAAVGVGRLRISEGLAKVATLLSAREKNVRTAAANALGALGGQSRPYLDLLASAIEAEQDEEVKAVMRFAAVRSSRTELQELREISADVGHDLSSRLDRIGGVGRRIDDRHLPACHWWPMGRGTRPNIVAGLFDSGCRVSPVCL